MDTARILALERGTHMGAVRFSSDTQGQDAHPGAGSDLNRCVARRRGARIRLP